MIKSTELLTLFELMLTREQRRTTIHAMDEMTGSQLVAYNLREARLLRGWTQDEAAERLQPYLGARWSKASFSAAERSTEGRRVRQFTADEIISFSQVFELPVAWFFLPPWSSPSLRIRVNEADRGLDVLGLVKLLFPNLELVEDVWRRLRSLKQWAPGDERWEETQQVVRDHVVALLNHLADEATTVSDLDVMAERLRLHSTAIDAIYRMTGRPADVDGQSSPTEAKEKSDEGTY